MSPPKSSFILDSSITGSHFHCFIKKILTGQGGGKLTRKKVRTIKNLKNQQQRTAPTFKLGQQLSSFDVPKPGHRLQSGQNAVINIQLFGRPSEHVVLLPLCMHLGRSRRNRHVHIILDWNDGDWACKFCSSNAFISLLCVCVSIYLSIYIYLSISISIYIYIYI